MIKFENIFDRTDKGLTAFNLRDCAYLEKFEFPKLIWKQTSIVKTFTLDKDGYFLDVSGQMLTTDRDGKYLLYILSILNSMLSEFFLKSISSKFGESGTRWIPAFIEQIPIPKISHEKQLPFVNLVTEILEAKAKGEQTEALERQIDLMVYKLYELTVEDIAVVEGRS